MINGCVYDWDLFGVISFFKEAWRLIIYFLGDSSIQLRSCCPKPKKFCKSFLLPVPAVGNRTGTL